MFRASVSHLVKILRLALRIAKFRKPHVRAMCGPAWDSNLDELSINILCKKLYFLLLHCGIATVDFMYGMGLFHKRDILSIVVRVIKQRNEHRSPMASRIFQRYRKYQFIISILYININFSSKNLLSC